MGDHLSFNGLYDNMVQAIKNGYEVVIERQYTNAIPTHLITFTNIDELESWKTRILNVAHWFMSITQKSSINNFCTQV